MSGAQPVAACFAGASIRRLRLPNRLIKAATAEGMCRAGVPSAELAEFHARLARGGVAMTTVAYCAAEADGRLDSDMMYMHEGIRAPLRRVVQAVHEAGGKVCAQLGHCGGFTRSGTRQGRLLGPSAGWNPLGVAGGPLRVGAMSPGQIRDRVAAFGRAAAFIESVGFDAIELHCGHGYLISQFLSPRTNQRTDAYGGSADGRLRFAREVLAAIRDAVSADYPLLGKISMSDGVRGGLRHEDAPAIARALERGGIDVVVCSDGTSSMSPMLMFRGESLAPALLEHESSRAMRLAIRAAAPWMMRSVPFDENFLLEPARRVRDALQGQACYLGGAASGAAIERALAAGFDFVQLGRVLLFDPDLPRALQDDPDHRSGCTHCNRCVGTIASPRGVHCPEAGGAPPTPRA